MNLRVLLICAGLLVSPCVASAQVAPPNDFIKALSDGTPLFDMRYRYENVQQAGMPHDDAFAETVRTRFGYETGNFDDFKVRVQIENLTPLSTNHYNNGENGLTSFPLIPDPRETVELYEANLAWQGLPQTNMIVGRQTQSLDNERWIGRSNWRQLGQTSDAVTVQNNSIDDVRLFYSYMFRAYRIYGTDAGTPGTTPYHMDAHLLNATYSGISGVKLVAYDYLLNFLNASNLSTQTVGSRVEWVRPLTEKNNFIFNGEYARQMSYGNNPASYAFNYIDIEPGFSVGPVTAKIAYESMGGNGNYSLQTPLDTRAFNGSADKFIITPSGGLNNVHASIEYKSDDHNEWLNSTTVRGTWFDFRADASSLHYGNEYDVWIEQTFFKHYTLGFLYAQYNADQLFTDTRKLIGQLRIGF